MLTILVNFSIKPLQISTVLGFIFGVLGVIGALYIIVDYFVHGIDVPGWSSLAVIMMILPVSSW
jgi:hypothetical protein